MDRVDFKPLAERVGELWDSAPRNAVRRPAPEPNVAVRTVPEDGTLEMFAVVDTPETLPATPTLVFVARMVNRNAQIYAIVKSKTRTARNRGVLIIEDSKDDRDMRKSPARPIACSISSETERRRFVAQSIAPLVSRYEKHRTLE